MPQQISSTRASGRRENLLRAAHGVGAPVAIDIEGEQVIGQVVAVRHAAEHAAHPVCRLLFVARLLAAWCRSCERGPDGVQHQLLLDTRNHRDLADPYRQHEMHFALHGLLIVHQAREQVLRGDAVSGGMGP